MLPVLKKQKFVFVAVILILAILAIAVFGLPLFGHFGGHDTLCSVSFAYGKECLIISPFLSAVYHLGAMSGLSLAIFSVLGTAIVFLAAIFAVPGIKIRLAETFYFYRKHYFCLVKLTVWAIARERFLRWLAALKNNDADLFRAASLG